MERWIEFAIRAIRSGVRPRRAQGVEMRAAVGRGGAGGDQAWLVANRAVAIDAIDFDGGARLAVEFAVAVAVLLEMAVDALHAFFQMNVREMHGFLEFFGIVERTTVCRLRRADCPWRSCLNTARKSQPWLWKSANCVFSISR